jgi:hypothetical protein
MFSKLPGPRYTITAIDSTKDLQTGLIAVQASSKASETGGLKETLDIAVGAKVMLIVNLDVSDGLVNGATGAVVNIVMNSHGDIDMILVKFDRSRVGVKASSESFHARQFPGAVPIKRHEVRFNVGRRKGAEMTRRQFPLTLAFGCTIHKTQGQSVDQIVVSMYGRYNAGQAYVALSRVTSIDGLFLTNFDATKIRASDKVAVQMKRLRENPAKYVTHSATTPTNVANTIVQSRKMLKMEMLNIRSYPANVFYLEETDNKERSDITFLTETHLTSNLPYVFGQHVVQQDREEGHGGGLLIMSRNGLQVTRLANPLDGECVESLLTEIQFHPDVMSNEIITLIAALFYIPPHTPRNLVAQSIAAVLHVLPHETQPTLILGDMNEDLIGSSSTPIRDLLEGNGFKQLIHQPTTDLGSLLDHVYFKCSSNNMVVVEASVSDCYFSDHDFVTIIVSANVMEE